MNGSGARQACLLFLLSALLSFAACGGGGGAAARDTTPAAVTAVVPLDNAGSVPVGTKTITAAFSEAMAPATLTTATFRLECPAGTPAAAGVVTLAGTDNLAVLTLPATPDLPPSTVCVATITTGAKDAAGNAFANDFVWRFTTGTIPDNVAPAVTAVVPSDHAAGVATGTKAVTAAFSEAMDPATLTTASFTLECPAGTPTATGVVTFDGTDNQATLTLPASPDLPPYTTCTATVTAAARDLAGNALAGDFSWHFSTVADDYRRFAVLGGASVVSTGATAVTGDLGVSPGVSVTGFPPGTVTGGTMHAGDAPAAQAQSELTLAYSNAAGTSCTSDLTGQDLGGKTLVPGVYCFSTSAQMTGQLTLDAMGNPDAVFLFQVGSTLTTASSSSVTFANGARAGMVSWQVGSSATLGTSSRFKGTIMAQNSVTMNAGATLDGRALARNGTVTLDGNTVTVPDP
jgi:hypothetical protein